MHAALGKALRERLEKWFFFHFFSLLLIAVSAGQAAVVWWVLQDWHKLGWEALLVASVVTTGFNRWWIRRRPAWQRAPVDRLPRIYNAFVFTCLFCALWLMANHGAWTVVRWGHGVLASEARGANGRKPASAFWHGGPRATGWFGILLITGLFAWGYTFGQRALRIRRPRLLLPRLSPQLEGLRIVQISDIHVGTNMSPEDLAYYVREVNALAPDLICITGDIADNAGSDLDLYFPILAELRAPLGVVAILGNHDHYAGASRVAEALMRHTDFHVLRDRAVAFSFRGTRFWVIGLDDRGLDWARGVPRLPQLESLVRALPPDECKILLVHRPDLFPQAAALGVDLVLSGHTHGGQLALPSLGARPLSLARFITRYDRGLFREGGASLYVNCGLGVTGQRIRLFTPREITVIELRGGSAAGGVPAEV